MRPWHEQIDVGEQPPARAREILQQVRPALEHDHRETASAEQPPELAQQPARHLRAMGDERLIRVEVRAHRRRDALEHAARRKARTERREQPRRARNANDAIPLARARAERRGRFSEQLEQQSDAGIDADAGGRHPAILLARAP